MFHGLCIPYIGKTNLSVKKPAARSLRSSLEQLTKSQLELICESYSDERFSKKKNLWNIFVRQLFQPADIFLCMKIRLFTTLC